MVLRINSEIKSIVNPILSSINDGRMTDYIFIKLTENSIYVQCRLIGGVSPKNLPMELHDCLVE